MSRKNTRTAGAEDAHEDAFFVPKEPDTSEKHDTPGMSGEAELVWRCAECGEMGGIRGMPNDCPSCDAPEVKLYYCTED